MLNIEQEQAALRKAYEEGAAIAARAADYGDEGELVQWLADLEANQAVADEAFANVAYLAGDDWAAAISAVWRGTK